MGVRELDFRGAESLSISDWPTWGTCQEVAIAVIEVRK